MRPFCLNVPFLPFVPFVVLFWSFSWFIMTVQTCFQIIQAEMRLENCPNLNRKFVIRASKVIQPKMSGSHNFPSGFHHPDAGPWPWPAAHNDGEAHLAPHWQLLSYAGLANVNQGREIYSIWLFDLSRIKSVLISQMFNMVESAFLSLQGFFVSLIFCYLNRWVLTTAKIQWVWQHLFLHFHERPDQFIFKRSLSSARAWFLTTILNPKRAMFAGWRLKTPLSYLFPKDACSHTATRAYSMNNIHIMLLILSRLAMATVK